MNLIPKRGGFEGQFRCGNAGRPRVVIMTKDKPNAEERAIRMQAAVELLVKAGRHVEARKALELMAAARNQRDFAGAEKAAHDIAATPLERTQAAITYRHVVELWLTGTIRMQDKDAAAEKGWRSVRNTRSMMKTILPILGDLPIASITDADCDKVKAALAQTDNKLEWRKKVCRTVRQVFKLAVEPLRLIKQPPISEDWIPKGTEPRRAFQMIYPTEDVVFLGCQQVKPLTRFYVGLLLRTGMRPGEGALLQWRDWSPSIGQVTLDKTKTRTPRSFYVDDDVAATFTAMRPEGAQPDDYIFESIRSNLAHVVRDILHPAFKVAGLDDLRPVLFTTNGARRPITAHDCRGAYVAVKTALGFNEREIMAVTGHMTSKEITTYQREAENLKGLVRAGKLEWYGPLDALMGLRAEPAPSAGGVARGVARVIDLHGKKARMGNPARVSQGSFPQSETAKTPVKATSNRRTRGAVPPEMGGVAQAGDDQAAALTTAIANATAAGKWSLALQLAGLLEGLKAARG